MKILFEIAHPKHYYQFKNVIKLLKSTHDVKIIARKKDIVCELLEKEGVQFNVYGGHGKNLKEKLAIVPKIFFLYFKLIKSFKPDIIISKSSPYAAIMGKLARIKTCIMPDSEVVTFNNRFVVPLSDLVVTPETYSLDYGEKHKRVSGFFEDSYLHPNFLDSEVQTKNMDGMPPEGKKVVILRFVGWYANHDIGRFGFSDKEKIKLVELLKPLCNVWISSEAPLPSCLDQFRFRAPVNMIHHALFRAALYIGDSQTMATEAALCGTPAIRYNSFVGENDMSNFKILEKKEMLTNLSDFDSVCEKALKIINDSSSKITAQGKRKEYFKEYGDINKEMADIIQHSFFTPSNNKTV